MEPAADKIIRIAVSALERPDGAILLVRKRGSRIFMQAGGKIEPGEAPLATLLRELDEELALRVAPEAAVHLGSFTAPAANEPGHWVQAEMFRLRWDGPEPRPRAEIEEAMWLDPLTGAEAGTGRRVPLASLLEAHLLPMLRRERARDRAAGR